MTGNEDYLTVNDLGEWINSLDDYDKELPIAVSITGYPDKKECLNIRGVGRFLSKDFTGFLLLINKDDVRRLFLNE